MPGQKTSGRKMMKRTTVFVDEDVFRQLRMIAKRENLSVSDVTRKALRKYVARRRPRLSLVGIGRSGRKDIAERSEEVLRKPKRPVSAVRTLLEDRERR